MTSRPTGTRRRIRATRLLTLSAVIAFGTLLCGCRFLDKFGWRSSPVPEQCVFGPNPTKEEIIRHINARSTRLTGWRSSDVKISSNRMLFSPDAMIAVSRPKNFRLIASTLAGNEADFGSNSERVWMWVRRSEPKRIATVRHEHLEAIEGRLPIPFRPDWLMELLGVVPLSGQNVQMIPRQPGDRMVRLVSQEYSPAGKIVQRTIVVDACNGNIVSYSLADKDGRVLMSAEFDNYQRDRHTGLKMPHRIDLKWPQTKMTMTLRIGTIEVNPESFAPNTWVLPKYDGYPRLNLARRLAGRIPTRRPQHRLLQHRQPNLGNYPGRARVIPMRYDGESGDRPRFREDESPQFAPVPAPVPAPVNRQQKRNPTATGPLAQPFPGSGSLERPHFADD